MTAHLLLQNALLVATVMTLLWGWSVFRRDASVVDPWWSIGFLLVAIQTLLASGPAPAKRLLAAMVALWAVRLWAHLLWRSRGKAEDPRYRAFRERFGPERYWWVSFFQVFLLQGTLLFVISAPLQAALANPVAGPIRWNHLAGLLLFAAGLGFEAVGDWQLHRFRSNRAKRGKVLDTGLWLYTRHPNYFGEAVLWWGFWLFAADAPWGLATVLAPALMTFLLLRVSGVTMLEAHLKKSRPGYRDYVKRTSAFLPRQPR